MFVIVYRRLGTAYQSLLQQHSSPETSVRDYQSTLRTIAEDLRLQPHCSGSLESRGKIYALIYALIHSKMRDTTQHIKNIYMRQDSSVNIVTRLGDGRSTLSCFDARRRQEDLFITSAKHSEQCCSPVSLLFNGHRQTSQG